MDASFPTVGTLSDGRPCSRRVSFRYVGEVLFATAGTEPRLEGADPVWRSRLQDRGRSERGQTLVEGAMALLVFFALLFAVIDCGLVLVSHQSLVERVRSAVRWGVVRPWDGTGEQIANLILYDQPDEPRSATGGYLGLTRENVQVRYQPSSAARPDDEVLSVAIVNYHYRFLSPWITQTFVNPRPVLITSPMAYRAAGL